MTRLVAYVTQYGVAVVFGLVLVEQIGIPIPALPALLVAGALVRAGKLSFLALLGAAVAASLLADTIWYLLGRRYGHRVLKTLCRVSLSPDSCVRQTEGIFEKWGMTSVVLAKFITGFSTVAPPLAGTMGVGPVRFGVYSAVAALLWAAAPVAGGFFFRTEVEWLLGTLEAMGFGAVVVLAAVVAAYITAKGTQRWLLLRFLRMVRISVADLRRMIDEGHEPVIFDVRSPLAREAEPRRIPGAIAVDLDTVERMLEHVPPGREVVVYCS